jgi:hypothetical protein
MDYESKLLQEINEDRQAHGKKPFADKEDDDADPPTKEVQQSTSDPESGLFHKGEHKKDFAYVTQTACDQNGWVQDTQFIQGMSMTAEHFLQSTKG